MMRSLSGSSKRMDISDEVLQASRIVSDQLKSSQKNAVAQLNSDADAKLKVRRLEAELQRAENKYQCAQNLLSKQQQQSFDNSSHLRQLQENRCKMDEDRLQKQINGTNFKITNRQTTQQIRNGILRKNKDGYNNDQQQYKQNELRRMQEHIDHVNNKKQVRDKQYYDFLQALEGVKQQRENQQIQFITQKSQIASKNQGTASYHQQQARTLREQEAILAQKLHQMKNKTQGVVTQLRSSSAGHK